MPAAWWTAFSYERPVALKNPEPPEPIEEIIEEPLFDPDTFDLWSYIPIRKQSVIRLQPNRRAYDIGLIMGLLIAILCIVLGII
jgi:hypothetical protein